MRRVHLPLILGLALAAAAPAAQALGPLYVTGKLGETGFEVDLGTAFPRLVDGDDNSWAAGLGIKLGRHVAVQAEYHDLGSVTDFGSLCPPGDQACLVALLPVAADSTAISISVLPHLSLTRNVRLYGKLGIVSWDSDISSVGEIGSGAFDELSKEELLYGGGLRVMLPGPLGVFAEYERIADTFDTAAIGVTWGF